MENKYKELFSPGKINQLTLKNRIIFPPMALSFDHVGGETTDKKIELYAHIARGGCAMLLPVTMFPDPFEERPAWHRALPYKVAKYDPVRVAARMQWAPLHWSEEYNPRLYDLTEAVHVNGSMICAALAPGVFGWAQRHMREHPDEELQGFTVFNRLTTGEVEAIIEEYVNVASWMRASDFDAIEMNMSVLADYFAMEIFNKREDKYGGDLDGRLRFIKELVQATREAVGPDFPLIYMFDPDHFTKGLRTLEESKVIARKVEEWGVDAIRARGGGWAKVEYEIPNMYLPAGADVHLAVGLKEVVNIPVITGGKLGNPDLAEKMLEEGKADFVAIGRALMADPDLPNKVRAGQADRVRKCISCNIGCLGRVTLVPRKGSRCTVNPLLGNEEKFRHMGQAAQKKKVVIVGAGPAGMSAALTAGSRGHEVILFEKTDKLGGGGQFYLGTIPPFKEDLFFIPEYYEREFQELNNVKIQFNTEADAEKVMQEKPDAVIIATGASALVPELPGADSSQVITYEDALLERKAVGSHAIVLGGANVGCETALYLLKKGINVTMLVRRWRFLDDAELSTRNTLMKELTEGGAEMIAGATVNSISGNEVNYVKDGKAATVKGDTIVLALGSKPENQLYYDLRDRVLSLHLVGDAKKPREILEAVSEGFYAAYYL
jgi:2,4-dienoyl-CoA reductase-like NADH-dependent reductase (Old Yellow Enzyme family)/thioredoxin reductase